MISPISKLYRQCIDQSALIYRWKEGYEIKIYLQWSFACLVCQNYWSKLFGFGWTHRSWNRNWVSFRIIIHWLAIQRSSGQGIPSLSPELHLLLNPVNGLSWPLSLLLVALSLIPHPTLNTEYLILTLINPLIKNMISNFHILLFALETLDHNQLNEIQPIGHTLHQMILFLQLLILLHNGLLGFFQNISGTLNT